MGHSDMDPAVYERRPWNAGQKVGPKRLLEPRGDDDGGLGVQCKNTVNGISLATVEKEIGLVEKFEPALDRLYIATTAKRDAPLQQDVRNLSAARKKAGPRKERRYLLCPLSTIPNKGGRCKGHDMALFEELTALLRSDGVIGF